MATHAAATVSSSIEFGIAPRPAYELAITKKIAYVVLGLIAVVVVGAVRYRGYIGITTTG